MHIARRITSVRIDFSKSNNITDIRVGREQPARRQLQYALGTQYFSTADLPLGRVKQPTPVRQGNE